MHLSKTYCTLLLLLIITACKNDKVDVNYITENIIIIVVDGPRYSETWGDPSNVNIPFLASIKPEGVFFSNFYNLGVTSTVPGHVALTTGFYEDINNDGQELPAEVSIFQQWIETYGQESNDAWLITSKDKLEVLSNCEASTWHNKYLPSTNCGINGMGVGSGYRHDSLTIQRSLEILADYHPKLCLINFREPDFSAHTNNWGDYINGIQITDEYIQQIWNLIESDPIYSGKTTLFITNDHGRHLDSEGGFSGHGDDCEGCKKISLLAIGPDFKKNVEVEEQHSLVDIHATMAQLLKLKSKGDGHVLSNIFK